ncbi:MAG TPA: hypothetical protein VIZ67_11305, partial [Acidimicrobiales bacterium]
DRRAMEEMGRRAVALVADFIDGLPDAPATNVGDVEPALPGYLLPWREEPGEFGELLDCFREAAAVAVDTPGPPYMAYVSGGGLCTSALRAATAPRPQPPPTSTNTIEIGVRDRHHQVVDRQGQRWLLRH